MENFDIISALRKKPNAEACIYGSDKYPRIKGKVIFHQVCGGVLVHAEIECLPQKCGSCTNPFYGFHIHSGAECKGNKSDPFANADGHYNPDNCQHPCHAGDMLPIFNAGGKAVLIFLTDKFNVSEISGKTVILHSMPDDFTTQPSGNAGEKMACGVIKPVCGQ